MTIKEAEEILENMNAYVSFELDDIVILDGMYTVDQLEAILLMMNNKGEENGLY